METENIQQQIQKVSDIRLGLTNSSNFSIIKKIFLFLLDEMKAIKVELKDIKDVLLVMKYEGQDDQDKKDLTVVKSFNARQLMRDKYKEYYARDKK